MDWKRVIPLSSGLLGVAFSEEVATKIGLQPGQSLKVHIPDDKHIVISLT